MTRVRVLVTTAAVATRPSPGMSTPRLYTAASLRSHVDVTARQVRDNLIAHPFFTDAPTGKKGGSVLSGIFGLAMATALCDGQVDVYAFSNRVGGFREVRYHYYDSCVTARWSRSC